MSPRGFGAAFLVATICLAWGGQARASEPCDRVVSYFLYPYQGSQLKQHEWRIFNPSRGSDTLFLALPGDFEGVRWDTTLTTTFFSSGPSLYRVEWKAGAVPKLIGQLPEVEGGRDWWFNPDSSCWQYAALRAIGPDADASRYWCELWQSSRDVSTWRRVRADTVDCEDGDCGDWPWYREKWARQAPARTVLDLAEEGSYDAQESRVARFDSTTVMVGGARESDWRFLPLLRSKRQGVAFRLLESSETLVSGPFYLVDLDRKSMKLIPKNQHDEEWSKWLLAEHCGLLLIPGVGGNPRVVDSASGRVVFSQPWNSEGAIWVRPPRP